MSSYELAPNFREQETPWHKSALTNEILQRVAVEKQRRELDVYYYRIGYTLSFPLPLNHKPTLPELPVGIPSMKYPWLTWLSWDLEERWRLLHLAWRDFGDEEAGLLLQRELAALSNWDSIVNSAGVGLATGHIAASLSLALADASHWKPEYLKQARVAAAALIERDVWPWFQKTWPEQELTPKQLANIPVIALARSAELARVIGNPHAADLEKRSREVLQVWCRFRTGAEHHTEGTAYDGYLMDSMTDGLQKMPERAQIQTDCREAFRSLADSWIALTVPDRPDLHVPLGDVEPEMTFWATALMRMTDWYDWPDARWLLRRVPLNRMRAAALEVALHRNSTFAGKLQVPSAGIRELPNAASLRTGWDRDDVLAAVGLSRGVMGHLHADSGQLILGWQGRCWITDPGYQQYRPGDEREFTLGDEAHNAPVIGGVKQTERAAKLEQLETNSQGQMHVRLNLTTCYRGFPADARVIRDVWLINLGGRAIVVRDSFKSLKPGVEIKTSWHGGTHFAWAFRDGWARLSDGQRALWIGTIPDELPASALHRHPGSRGPLTLTHSTMLPDGDGVRWWIFFCDPTTGWTAPAVRLERGALNLKLPGESMSWTIK